MVWSRLDEVGEEQHSQTVSFVTENRVVAPAGGVG
jgi:hypothetical protein